MELVVITLFRHDMHGCTHQNFYTAWFYRLSFHTCRYNLTLGLNGHVGRIVGTNFCMVVTTKTVTLMTMMTKTYVMVMVINAGYVGKAPSSPKGPRLPRLKEVKVLQQVDYLNMEDWAINTRYVFP